MRREALTWPQASCLKPRPSSLGQGARNAGVQTQELSNKLEATVLENRKSDRQLARAGRGRPSSKGPSPASRRGEAVDGRPVRPCLRIRRRASAATRPTGRSFAALRTVGPLGRLRFRPRRRLPRAAPWAGRMPAPSGQPPPVWLPLTQTVSRAPAGRGHVLGLNAAAGSGRIVYVCIYPPRGGEFGSEA